MNDLSPLGWIAIGFIALIFIVTNVGLFSLLKKKGSEQSEASILSETFKTLKNPWEKENQHLRELSSRVSNLQNFQHKQDEDK
ncbi:MAG: hypothetical protein AB1522_13300 [Chloroflexota bacterium]